MLRPTTTTNRTNPVKERVNFQKVCDYILDQRATYLGEDQESARLERLKQYALELGFEPEEALRRLTQLARWSTP